MKIHTVKGNENLNRILTTKEATRDGFSKYALNQYVRENDYERVQHGVYARRDELLDDLYLLHFLTMKLCTIMI